MFRNVLFRALAYLWPSRLFSELGRILTEWQGADVREKGVLLLVFTPMMVCILGLLFSVISFVLFVLPSFVLRVLGWGVLITLFGAGGVYCHDKLKGRGGPHSANKDFYDVTEDTFEPADSVRKKAPSFGQENTQQEERPSWFENVRKMRWRE